MQVTSHNLVEYSLARGEQLLSARTQQSRKRLGQFLTPARAARFMARQLGLARQLGPLENPCTLLDPALGAGTLTCAVVERVLAEGNIKELWVEGYEVDEELCEVATQVLGQAVEVARSQGVALHVQVHPRDFVLEHASRLEAQLSFWDGFGPASETDASAHASVFTHANAFSHVIANPPYFKLNKRDLGLQQILERLEGHTNIYTVFMALSLSLLAEHGRACFIIPRSFCSGAYFSAFRQELFEQIVPLHIHLFESRGEVFKAGSVLQENIIFTFRKRQAAWEENEIPQTYLSISTSQDTSDLPLSDAVRPRRQVNLRHFLCF